MEEIDLDEKLNNVACLIRFIILLDNNGKMIYSRYYINKSEEKQREFEKQLCYQVKNLNVLPGEIDIFQYANFNIFINIIGEITYFVGLNEEDNESLGYNFCELFENNLSMIVRDNFQRSKIFENLEKIMILIDEMLYNGIVVNTDKESITKLIMQEGQGVSKFISFGSTESGNSGGGGLLSSIFSGARSIFG